MSAGVQPLCSPLTTPLLMEDATNEKEAEAGPVDKTPPCNDSHSESLFEPVTVGTEPTKDEHKSGVEPSEKEAKVQQPISEEQEAVDEEDEEEEEDPVSPVLDLDPSLDMEVMELMSSSLPPALLHLSSRRGKGRSLRFPPCYSRPSDDLSIRLRQSPFSTEASPETSPARVPITPPPLTPPSPPLRSSPSSRASPPFSKVNLTPDD